MQVDLYKLIYIKIFIINKSHRSSFCAIFNK